MKIIIIGCPGAGKSVLTRRINEFLGYPVLHMDRIYHTGGKSHISRDELIARVKEFAAAHDRWIIDGNYISTLDMRVGLADTVVLLGIPPEVCLRNAIKRSAENQGQGMGRSDMASGFDETITGEFVGFIRNFDEETLPKIHRILMDHPDKNVVIIRDYAEYEAFIDNLKQTAEVI